MLYTGRDNKTSHKGMGITEADWDVFMGHLNDTLNEFAVPDREKQDVVDVIESTRADIVD